jgi:glycosyltransferase involved in cell wall biosynthesis
LKLDGAHLVISYAGALSEERSVVQLVEAIRGCPEVVAIVAGYGPAEKQIAEFAQVVPNLRFLGKRDATDIPLITAVSDAVYYCLKNATGNSFYSAPNKLFEAMAAGKAIIAVRGAGEIGEIVAARDLGVLVNKPEPQALKEGLHELLNPEKLRRWQQNAARAYSETYSWERAEQGLIAVYETLWDGADG